MNTAVYVRAPCRLHFGMFGFGHPDKAQYGGVGVMVEPPSVKVTISSASRFAVSGSHLDRARQIIELLVSNWALSRFPTCDITVDSPRSHTGLGVGTQLSLAIAAGLRRFLNLSDLSVEDLAAASGRGMRSAVGTHGFQCGGLIVDAGKVLGQKIGKLTTRMLLPDSWRFVLVCPVNGHGLAGTSEATAFTRLPPVPEEITRELWLITNERMLPAVERHDCQAFGEAVYRFGRLAGECFSAVQGGPFASEETVRLIATIREFVVPGVGQSSWGPTVFAITSNDDEAERLVDWVRRRNCGESYEISVARANNTGAMIESCQ